MELECYAQHLAAMRTKINQFRGHFDLDALNERITENEGRMAEPGFLG